MNYKCNTAEKIRWCGGVQSSIRRSSVIIIDNFYDNPDEIRINALSYDYYTPYNKENSEGATDNENLDLSGNEWMTSKQADKRYFIKEIIEEELGEGSIDIEHWNSGTIFNGKFHVKTRTSGCGFHQHVVDGVNAVGLNGWSGIVFLGPPGINVSKGVKTRIPLDDPPEFFPHSIYLNENRSLDDIQIGNIYNRAIFMRGDIFHTGTEGIGNRVDNGRLIQTFFLKTQASKEMDEYITNEEKKYKGYKGQLLNE